MHDDVGHSDNDLEAIVSEKTLHEEIEKRVETMIIVSGKKRHPNETKKRYKL